MNLTEELRRNRAVYARMTGSSETGEQPQTIPLGTTDSDPVVLPESKVPEGWQPVSVEPEPSISKTAVKNEVYSLQTPPSSLLDTAKHSNQPLPKAAAVIPAVEYPGATAPEISTREANPVETLERYLETDARRYSQLLSEGDLS